MSKRKKKSGSKDEHRAIVLNLLAALINLVVAILYFIDKLTERRKGGRETPSPINRLSHELLNVKQMNTAIYVLCGISISLSIAAIIISTRGLRRHGSDREKKKD